MRPGVSPAPLIMSAWVSSCRSMTTGPPRGRASPRSHGSSGRSVGWRGPSGAPPAGWGPPSNGSSSRSSGPCPPAGLRRRRGAPSDSRASSSIPPRPPRRPFAELPHRGVRSVELSVTVAAGGAEPTRESCRGRHAQAPGPGQVRRPEHDADETLDTCSPRPLARRRFQVAARTTLRPHDVAPSPDTAPAQVVRIGASRSDSRCSEPSMGWMPSSISWSAGTNASQSAIVVFG